MKQQGLLHFDDTYLTAIALVLFLWVFVAIVIRVYRKRNKEHYRKMAQMPLDDETTARKPS